MTLPCASFTAADNVVDAPTAIDAAGGDTVTDVTTGGGGGTVVTVTAEVPTLSATVAVIVAEPAATAVTIPLVFTVAAFASLVDQTTVCPVISLPDSSFIVATSGWFVPTMSEAVAGETATEVTTGTGGSVVTPVPPSEHTASCGRNSIQPQWRAILREVEDLFGMRLSPADFRVWSFVKVPGNKMPPRHR
jgi:hypothetical protein